MTTAYAKVTLENSIRELSELGVGNRNNRLNEVAYKLGTLVPEFYTEYDVFDVLMRASYDNGMISDDGEAAARATALSGMRSGMTNPRQRRQGATRPALGAFVPSGGSSGPVASGPVGKELTRSKASAVSMKRVKWLWRNRIPLGELTLIAGREGVGKSTYLADMAAKITTGTARGEYSDSPRSVFYIAAEDSWEHTIVPRLTAAGADLDRIFRIETVTDGGIVLPRHCEELATQALESDTCAIMLDPVVSFIDDELSVNQTRDLRKALEPLRRSAERANVAVISLVHFNKAEGMGDLLSMIAGARGWAEVCRSAIALAKDEDAGHYVLSQAKSNLGRLDLRTTPTNSLACLSRPRTGRLSRPRASSGPATRRVPPPTSSPARSRWAGRRRFQSRQCSMRL